MQEVVAGMKHNQLQPTILTRLDIDYAKAITTVLAYDMHAVKLVISVPWVH